MKRGPYKSRAAPGTFADLIGRFWMSPRYKGWSAATQKQRDPYLRDFLAANGRAQVADLRRSHIIAMRDSLSDTPGKALNWLSTIRLLLDYAVDLEMVPHNVARAKLPPLKRAHDEGFRVWREDEIEAYLAHHKDGTKRLALLVLLYTGASRSDAVKLGPGNIVGDRIVYRRRKTGNPANVPILPELREALEALPPRHVWLLNVHGAPFDPKGLIALIQRGAAEAGLGGRDEYGRRLSPHGLRKALGRRLADAGCDDRVIADVLGQSSLSEVPTYTRDRDKALSAERAREALAKVEAKVVRMRMPDGGE